MSKKEEKRILKSKSDNQEIKDIIDSIIILHNRVLELENKVNKSFIKRLFTW
jgi:ABC-type Na+ transport system ATPase subunit NatA